MTSKLINLSRLIRTSGLGFTPLWLGVLLFLTPALAAWGATEDDGFWDPRFGLPGLQGYLGADRERVRLEDNGYLRLQENVTAGALGPNGELYVGGSFSGAGGRPAANVACWNPVTRSWQALGSGLSVGLVNCLMTDAEGVLYAGGSFDRAGDSPAENLAYWEHGAWQAIHGLTGRVNTILVLGHKDLVVGGSFEVAGSTSRHVARWVGGSWRPLGGGIADDLEGAVVCALAQINGRVVVGGKFTAVKDTAGNRLVRGSLAVFDPGSEQWTDAGGGGVYFTTYASGLVVFPGEVEALAVYQGDLIVGGHFNTLGGQTGLTDSTSAQTGQINLARVSGGSLNQWAKVGGGIRLSAYEGRLDSGSLFRARVTALAVQGGELLVGGEYFDRAGDLVAPSGVLQLNVVRWDGTAFQGFAQYPAFYDRNPQLHYPRWFLPTAAGFYAVGATQLPAPAPAASEWRRTGGVLEWVRAADQWAPLGPPEGVWGLNGAITAMGRDRDGSLIVAGTFTTVGGNSIRNLARWDGSAFTPVADVELLTIGYAPPPGQANRLHALAVAPNGDLVVGGEFTHLRLPDGQVLEANHLARWDGSQWSTLGEGVNDLTLAGRSGAATVRALLYAPNGDLYVGGTFLQAGGAEARHIARWDGSQWHPLLDPALLANGLAAWQFDPNGFLIGHVWGRGTGVFSLAMDSTGALYAGGTFNGVGASPEIAGWVMSAVSEARLSLVARWDGAHWSPLGEGLSAGGRRLRHTDENGEQDMNYENTFRLHERGVRSLAFDPAGHLYAGGSFRRAGGRLVNHIARWDGTRWWALGEQREASLRDLMLPSDGPGVFGNMDGFQEIGRLFYDNEMVTGNRVTPLDNYASTGLLEVAGYLEVHALGFDAGTNLYVAGTFTQAGLTNANHIARWDGLAWHPLGSGVWSGDQAPGAVLLPSATDKAMITSLIMTSNRLYVGGCFTMAGANPSFFFGSWTHLYQPIHLPLPPVPGDRNHDGIPDAWEDAFFAGHPFDPNADSDHDGLNNRAEFRLGTNPTNASSGFRITSLTRTNNQWALCWEGISGKSYLVEQFLSLGATNSYPLVVTETTLTNTAPGLATPGVCRFTSTNLPGQFFRVRVTD